MKQNLSAEDAEDAEKNWLVISDHCSSVLCEWNFIAGVVVARIA